jgi:hypothetical protein
MLSGMNVYPCFSRDVGALKKGQFDLLNSIGELTYDLPRVGSGYEIRA